MNPCPCGYLGDPLGRCQCTTEQVNRYRHKISAPLLDRIDIHLEVPRVKLNLIRSGAKRLNNALTLPVISLYRAPGKPMPYSRPPTLKPFAPYPNQTIKYLNKPLIVSDCLTGAITEYLNYPVP